MGINYIRLDRDTEVNPLLIHNVTFTLCLLSTTKTPRLARAPNRIIFIGKSAYTEGVLNSHALFRHTTLMQIQSTLVISNSKGLSETLWDIRISTYKIFRIEEKIIRTTTFNKYIYIIGLLTLEIYWKYCGKEENFSSFLQYFLLVVRFSCLGRDQIFT